VSTTMTVYLLHYEKPIGDLARPRMTAQHYVGSYWNPGRIASHRAGTSGVPIVAAFARRGIPFTVARLARGGRELERAIKNAGQHRRHCPVCTAVPWRGRWGELIVPGPDGGWPADASPG
jgi:hypothetical protein